MTVGCRSVLTMMLLHVGRCLHFGWTTRRSNSWVEIIGIPDSLGRCFFFIRRSTASLRCAIFLSSFLCWQLVDDLLLLNSIFWATDNHLSISPTEQHYQKTKPPSWSWKLLPFLSALYFLLWLQVLPFKPIQWHGKDPYIKNRLLGILHPQLLPQVLHFTMPWTISI